MTDWRPPQYPQTGAMQPPNMQAQPVDPNQNPYLRPITR